MRFRLHPCGQSLAWFLCRIGIGYLMKIACHGDAIMFKHFYFVIIAGLRSFDMMSDWAFFALSLALNSDFHRRYPPPCVLMVLPPHQRPNRSRRRNTC